MDILRHLSKDNFKYVSKIFLDTFKERLNVFMEIFGFSFLVAIVAAVFLVLLVKYFLYALFFFIGIIVCAFMVQKEDFLLKKTLSLITWAFYKVKQWVASLHDLNHC